MIPQHPAQTLKNYTESTLIWNFALILLLSLLLQIVGIPDTCAAGDNEMTRCEEKADDPQQVEYIEK
jgi:hypothetical protein